MTFIDALGPHGAYRARNRVTVHDVAGSPLAELSVVPSLFVTRAAPPPPQPARPTCSLTAWRCWSRTATRWGYRSSSRR
jgi:hypothetical protein